MTEVRQEFYGVIEGDIAGRDIVKVHHSQSRVLTPAERTDLNNKVKRLSEEYGEHGGKTWSFLHRAIGIASINDMRLDHRDSGHAILDLMLDCAAAKCAQKELPRSAEASAVEQASLVLQNSELSARLNESQRSYIRTKKLLDEEKFKAADYKSKWAESTVALEKGERLLNASVASFRKAEDDGRNASKRASRLFLLSMFLGLALAGTAYAGFGQYLRANEAIANLSQCVFDGKSYGLGSIIDRPSTADIECLQTGKASPHWETVKRSRQQR